MTDLTSKKTLIIGGSRGIGAAIVRRFVKDGAQVAFTYSGSHDAAQALSQQTGASAIRSDAADRQQQRVERRRGGIVTRSRVRWIS